MRRIGRWGITRIATTRSITAAMQRRELTDRVMPFLITLPFNMFEAIGRAGFYCTWHFLYLVACAFRAFTDFMLVAAVVMLPMALSVFINPS